MHHSTSGLGNTPSPQVPPFPQPRAAQLGPAELHGLHLRLCKFPCKACDAHAGLKQEECLLSPTHPSNTRQHLEQTFGGRYCNLRINVTLIWPTLPFATLYGTLVLNVNKRKFLFPHDETSLRITCNFYQQVERQTDLGSTERQSPPPSTGDLLFLLSSQHLRAQQAKQTSVDVISKKLHLWFTFHCVAKGDQTFSLQLRSHGRPPGRRRQPGNSRAVMHVHGQGEGPRGSRR